MNDWAVRIVAHLARSKRDGLDFEHAWTLAVAAHPPRGRDMGSLRPTLFEEADASVVDFTRRVAEDAWHDRNPSLRAFSLDALREMRRRDLTLM